VVIGSNNSAHDICAALWEHGADVTMVQRSSTHVVKSDSLMEIGLGALYSEEAVRNGITTDKADMIFASMPYRIMHRWQIPLYEKIKERDADFYARLEKAGFALDFGDDGSGLFMKYLRRGSGYYIDVGACDLVINGDIKLARGQVSHLTRDAVVLEDGTELPADLVVYATGYGSMNGWVADLVGKEMADKVGKCWGLGSDTTKDPGPWEGACGSPPSRRACGSTAATCTSPGTTPCTWRCSSRPGTRASPPRCTACRRYTTCPDPVKGWGSRGRTPPRPGAARVSQLPSQVSDSGNRNLANRRKQLNGEFRIGLADGERKPPPGIRALPDEHLAAEPAERLYRLRHRTLGPQIRLQINRLRLAPPRRQRGHQLPKSGVNLLLGRLDGLTAAIVPKIPTGQQHPKPITRPAGGITLPRKRESDHLLNDREPISRTHPPNLAIRQSP